jgi:septal ring factor EnvC (AmiA/AmiB activator)
VKKLLTGLCALLLACPLEAEPYSVLIHRYEGEIRRQERQLRSLQSNLHEKQEKAETYRRLAEKAHLQWERLTESVKTAQMKVVAVRNELVKTGHQVQAAGWQAALETRLSDSIDSELALLTTELYQRRAAAQGTDAISESYPTQVAEHLTAFAPVVRQDAQTAKRQHQALENMALHWQAEESKRSRDAAALKQTQADQWRRMQDAQRREQLLKEEVAQAEQSAQALQVMLAQLRETRDQAKSQRRHSSGGSTDPRLAQLRGRLPWPAPGDVVQSFGRQYSSDLNQLLVSNGIRVQAHAGQSVRTVQPGQVIFARPFHTYGEMVVVQHSNGLASVYAGLAAISVKEGSTLGALEPIGKADETGRYYFELRQEERPLDPLVYLTPTRRMSS